MSARKSKILIIDDDDLVRETVRLALEQAGFEAATLESGASALDVVRESGPDLILMDLYMPGEGGLELCRRLKADPNTRAIPVVVFTGSNETIDVMSGIEAGAFEYITKPIDGASLIEKIRKILKLAPPKKDAG